MKALKENYRQTIKGLDSYGATICTIISEVLRDNGIQVHSITYRVKDFKSVSRKVNINPEKYSSLEKLTDMLGVRIITYFPYDVDKVATALEKEFRIDRQNSVDKRKLLDPDKFGYLSLHHVVSLSKSRGKLVEYKKFSDFPFEIQVRSILQHAWAEIEHDLGYKAEGSLPDEMRRSFSRLAGMLEFADEEFERIRQKIGAYEEHVVNTIEDAPQTLMIDQSTVTAALKTEVTLKSLDQAIVRASESATLLDNFDIDYISSHAKELKTLRVKDVSHLIKLAKAYESYVEKFAYYWLRARPNTELPAPATFSRSIGLFYLCYVIVAQLPQEMLVDWNPQLKKTSPKIIEEVHVAWKKVLKDLGEPPRAAKEILPR